MEGFNRIWVDINIICRNAQSYNLSMSRAMEPSYETTLLVRDRCLCLYVQRAARALARHFDDAFRHLGLTHGQFSLMMSLNRPESPGMGEVAALLAMDRTTLTAALKPLERRGLVRVSRDPDDRRGRRMKLTASGRRLLASAVPIWKENHVEIESLLGNDRATDRLRESLQALTRRTDRTSPSPGAKGQGKGRLDVSLSPRRRGRGQTRKPDSV